jgi:hypothetical protein
MNIIIIIIIILQKVLRLPNKLSPKIEKLMKNRLPEINYLFDFF